MVVVDSSVDPVDAAPPPPEGILATAINVTSMALTTDDVIWSDGPGSGSVFAVKKTGGPTRVIAKGPNADAVTVDAAHLYFAYGLDGDRAIGRMPLAGGPVVDIAKHQLNPSTIVVRGTRVYWLNSGGSKLGGLYSADLDGANPRVHLTGLEQASNLVVTETDALFRDGEWGGGHRLVRTSLATGTTTELAAGVWLVHHIAVQKGAAFFLTSSDAMRSDLMRVDVAAGGPLAILATHSTGGYWPGCIVADDTNLYFQLPFGTSLQRLPLSGGKPIPLTSVGTVTAMAADEERLYWGEQTATFTGSVVRAIAK